MTKVIIVPLEKAFSASAREAAARARKLKPNKSGVYADSGPAPSYRGTYSEKELMPRSGNPNHMSRGFQAGHPSGKVKHGDYSGGSLGHARVSVSEYKGDHRALAELHNQRLKDRNAAVGELRAMKKRYIGGIKSEAAKAKEKKLIRQVRLHDIHLHRNLKVLKVAPAHRAIIGQINTERGR